MINIKKRYVTLIVACVCIFLTSVTVQAAMEAKPTTSKIYVNGEEKKCAAYYINGNNYFKLRDLAYALNGTNREFSVKWDNQKKTVLLTSGESYTPIGNEMEPVENISRSANVTSSNILVDGQTLKVQGYNIGGNNYFKLRDITNIFNISVIWNGKTNTIHIETGQGEQTERVLSAKEIYDRCSDAVFYIETYDIDGDVLSSGSGFFLDSDGKAVTNFHVLQDSYSAKITTADGNRFAVKGVIGYDIKGDLAILQIDGSGFAYLSLGDSDELTSGEKIYTISSPMGLSNTISEGIVSGINRTIGDIPYIQITAAISHGSSGGALLNEKGQAVGITSAGLAQGQNLNFAIPINAISTLNTDTFYSFSELVVEYTIYSYYERAKPFENVVMEQEPNDLFETSQFLENGSSVIGTMQANELDNYYVFCGSPGVLELYCYSDAENFDKMAVLAEDLYGKVETLGKFVEMEDGKKGMYLLLPVLEPGYYHIMLGTEEKIQKEEAIEYIFYYQFIPEGVEW